MKIFSIEGNIGSGKSTILKQLINEFADTPEIIFLPEPVDVWNTIVDPTSNLNILQKFYSNQEKYAFPFQMLAFITRLQQLNNIISELNNKNVLIITERSVYTDRYVFAKMLYDSGLIEPICYQIYLKWFDEVKINIDQYIYLKVDPEECSKRISSRKREGEESIPIEYLKDCDKYHSEWLFKLENVLVINNNETNPQIIKSLIEFINLFKNMNLYDNIKIINMEVQLKKTLKVISKEYEIPYEDLKNTSKKYLKYAKSYDTTLYQTIDELLELVEISDVSEIDEYDINTIKMFCKLRDIDFSGSEKEIRKRVASYFEDLFEELDDSELDDEDSDSDSDSESDPEEPDSEPEEPVVVKSKKSNLKKSKVPVPTE